MTRYLLRRAGTALLVLLGVTAITFALARVIPSNPAVAYIGPKARPADVAAVEHQLGLDRPLPVQYAVYLRGVATGDLGTSIGTKRPVLAEIADRLPATLELLLAALLLAAVAGVVLGVVAAARRGRIADALIRLLGIGGVSVPAFWLGLVLQLVVFGRLRLLPPTGATSAGLALVSPIHHLTGIDLLDCVLTGNWTGATDVLRHLLLPALTLAAYPTGMLARMTRATMLEALASEHVRVARAYGVGERALVWRQALRNALPPTTTVLGLTAAYSLTGTFFVEVVFAWPGLGQFAAESLLRLDYPAIMGVTLLGAVAYVLVNLLVDLAHAVLDPRVRPGVRAA